MAGDIKIKCTVHRSKRQGSRRPKLKHAEIRRPGHRGGCRGDRRINEVTGTHRSCRGERRIHEVSAKSTVILEV